MILALKVVAAIVVVIILAVVALRVRKLRRDEIRALSRPVERRLMAPPPSPYAPSKGFRLLDSDGAPLQRPPLERPRLDPTRHYVFNESSGHSDEVVTSNLRHSDDWFLSRSSSRSTLSILLRRVVVVVVVALVVAVLATYYVHHHRTPATHHATTTTANTTTSVPDALRATSASGDVATYDVKVVRYRVTVTATRGATSVVYDAGTTNTVAFEGTLEANHDESLVLSGDARITIGSPSNASVVIDGRDVVLPTPLPPTLALVIRAGS